MAIDLLALFYGALVECSLKILCMDKREIAVEMAHVLNGVYACRKHPAHIKLGAENTRAGGAL